MGYSLRQITGLLATVPRRHVPVAPAPANLEGYVADRELRLNQLRVATSALEVIARPSAPSPSMAAVQSVAKDALHAIQRHEDEAA